MPSFPPHDVSRLISRASSRDDAYLVVRRDVATRGGDGRSCGSRPASVARVRAARRAAAHGVPSRWVVGRRRVRASRALDAADGPGLRDFMPSASSGGCGAAGATTVSPRPADAARDGEGRRKAYIETYGCQMNVNDSEIVASVLASSDYDLTDALPDADAILVNTCAIRENAESKVWHRLRQLRAVKRDRERAARREAKRAMSDRSGVFVATPPRPPPSWASSDAWASASRRKFSRRTV